MIDKEWVDEVIFNLNKARKKQNSKDERLLQLNKVSRIVHKVGFFSDSCKECNSYKKQLEDFAIDPKSYITFSNKIKEFDVFINIVSKHLETEHKIRPIRYYTSLYSFFGMLIGSLIGVLINYLISEEKLFSGALIGWVVGLVIGRLIGVKKDYNNKNNNKQY